VQSQEYQDTSELLAPALEVLTVHLRLLQLGPGAVVLEPHFHLPRLEACSQAQPSHYYKNRFVMPAGNWFLVSARINNTICVMQKIIHFWCRLSLTDTKDTYLWCQFLKWTDMKK
jgi:hypothetical protein